MIFRQKVVFRITLLLGDRALAKCKFLAQYKKCATVCYTGAKQWEGQLRYSEGCLGEVLESTRLCQNLISGDRCFILGILLPHSWNKPSALAPEKAAGPCWISAWGGLVLCMGCIPGFPSPWIWR